MDKDFLFALYSYFKAQEAVSKSINDLLAHFPFKPCDGSLDIDSEPLWPSWRHELTDEETERLNRNSENHCASGL